MLWHKLNVLTCLCCQWMMDCIKKTVKLKKSRKIYLLFTFRMYLNVFIYFWPKYMFPAIEFPSVERGCLYIFWPCRLQSYQMSIKRWSSLGSIRRLSAGYLERGPGFYFLGSWVCDVMATMTGCWAGVTWCWADSVKPSSSILGRLVWGSPGCSAKVSALGCLLTSTGGELEAWAAKIWRGLLRPGREIQRKQKHVSIRLNLLYVNKHACTSLLLGLLQVLSKNDIICVINQWW